MIEVGTWQRGFVSFDLANLPGDLVQITAAQLSMYQAKHDDAAYTATTGKLMVESLPYGALDVGDFFKPATEICLPLCAALALELSDSQANGWKSANVLAIVNRDWNLRADLGSLSQFRLRFVKENNGAGPDVAIALNASEAGAGQPARTVTYTHP